MNTFERLEPRQLFAVSAFPNVNVAPLGGNQSEPAIAVDPTNPNRLFVASNDEANDDGLMASISVDGGATWTHRPFLDGTDGLPLACCDSTAAFDEFGNLFFAYANGDDDGVTLLLSTDGGATFDVLTDFAGRLDQPTVAAGAGQVWITFANGSKLQVAGAAVSGSAVAGPAAVGSFTEVTNVPGARGGTFGDIAIGPDGQVVVTYQKRSTGGRNVIGVNVDPDGVGPAPLGSRVNAATTGVSLFEYIPAQPFRGIDAEAALAIDHSAGPHRGRIYLAYTDESVRPKFNNDIFLRYSDDLGATWSLPARVNDDTGTNSQFFPRMVIDPADGQIALTWYDAREDLPDPADPLDIGNVEVALYGARAASVAGGVAISASVRISEGVSDVFDTDADIDLGDYLGLTIADGIAHPAWADNSNSTGDNPNGEMDRLDIYTASVPLADLPAATRLFAGGLPVAGSPLVDVVAKKGPLVVRNAKPLRFVVKITDADGIDESALSTSLRLTGPNAFDEPITLLKSKTNKKGITTAKFEIAGPDGAWTADDNGSYAIALQTGGIVDLPGNAAAAGTIGDVVVDAF